MRMMMMMICSDHLNPLKVSNSCKLARVYACVVCYLFPSGSINLDALREGKIDPQEMMKMSKKGKPIMLFIGIRGQPDRERTEQVSSLWAQSLQNAHLQVIGVDRFTELLSCT